jgi:hypothetical protein
MSRPATVRSLARRALALVDQLEEIERLRAQRRRIEVAVLVVQLEAAEARTPVVDRTPLVERPRARGQA